MLKFDYNERPTSAEILKDPYWGLDLSKCPKVGEILSKEENEIQDAIAKVEKTKKGDKMTFLTRENNFAEFYQTIVEKMYTDELKQQVGFVNKPNEDEEKKGEDKDGPEEEKKE